MRDEDGPLLAKVVYSRLFNREEDPIRLCHLINRQVNATLHRNQLEAVAWVKHSEDRSAVSPQLLVVREPQVHRMDGLSIHDMAMNAASMAIEVLKVAKPEARALSELPLADIIDAFARKLRQEGARPERWATFVHVGI